MAIKLFTLMYALQAAGMPAAEFPAQPPLEEPYATILSALQYRWLLLVPAAAFFSWAVARARKEYSWSLCAVGGFLCTAAFGIAQLFWSDASCMFCEGVLDQPELGILVAGVSMLCVIVLGVGGLLGYLRGVTAEEAQRIPVAVAADAPGRLRDSSGL
ncbi:MAG: hypothetical protein ACJ74Q_15325 [Pyrinomonadaceae bacterium]